MAALVDIIALGHSSQLIPLCFCFYFSELLDHGEVRLPQECLLDSEELEARKV